MILKLDRVEERDGAVGRLARFHEEKSPSRPKDTLAKDTLIVKTLRSSRYTDKIKAPNVFSAQRRVEGKLAYTIIRVRSRGLFW